MSYGGTSKGKTVRRTPVALLETETWLGERTGLYFVWADLFHGRERHRIGEVEYRPGEGWCARSGDRYDMGDPRNFWVASKPASVRCTRSSRTGCACPTRRTSCKWRRVRSDVTTYVRASDTDPLHVDPEPRCDADSLFDQEGFALPVGDGRARNWVPRWGGPCTVCGQRC